MSTKSILIAAAVFSFALVTTVVAGYAYIQYQRYLIVRELEESGLALLKMNEAYAAAGLVGATTEDTDDPRLVASLKLNEMTSGALRARGFHMIPDLTAHSESDLATFLDPKSLAEVRDRLKAAGHSLNGADPKTPIASLKLSEATTKALVAHKIGDVGGLTSKSEFALKQLPLPDAAVAEVKMKLGERNLSLMPWSAIGNLIDSTICP